MRRLLCWLLGHADDPVLAPTRLYLLCARCGRETPGWTGLVASTLSERRRRAQFWAWADARAKLATPALTERLRGIDGGKRGVA